MKKAWLALEVLIAFLCICIVAVLLARIWPSAEKPKVLDILTAIGTVGAAIAAVFVALWQDHRLRIERIDRAHLRASALTMRVAWTRAELKVTLAELDNAKTFDCAPDTFAIAASRLRGMNTWTTEELEPLVPLPNECAHQLAGALDRIDVAMNHLATFAATQAVKFSDERKHCASYVSLILSEADEMIGRATNELQRASFAVIHKTRVDSGSKERGALS